MTPPSFVDSLRIAAPYIHHHRGRTFVVLVGGEAALDRSFENLMPDVALLHGLGVRLVLVHGTRPQIDNRIAREGLEPQFVAGVRVTDRAALACVTAAVGEAQMRFMEMLSMGAAYTPMAGARIRVVSGNFVTARPIGVKDGVDYRFTGEVRRIDADGIAAQLSLGSLVLVSPIGASPTGESFNLSSHDLAAKVAVALGADKLVGLIEGRGVLDGRRRPISQLTPTEAEELARNEKRHPEDVRKHLGAAAGAVRAGIQRAHLVPRRRDGALLKELFTRDGEGTLITKELYEDVRPAVVEDVGPLSALLAPLEEAGVLVRRSLARLEMEVGRFTVVDRDSMIIGCAALEPFPDEQMGELYCVAIHPRFREQGRGDALLERIEGQARELGLTRLFVLTTRSAHFFQERGYQPASVRQLPKLRQKSYDRRRKSRVLIKAI